jgi:hypothetical protein
VVLREHVEHGSRGPAGAGADLEHAQAAVRRQRAHRRLEGLAYQRLNIRATRVES